jgi:hypothetical protein
MQAGEDGKVHEKEWKGVHSWELPKFWIICARIPVVSFNCSV